MMKSYIKALIIISISQSVFALDIVQTRYGELAIRPIGDYEKGLFLDTRLIFKRTGGYLDIERLFSIANNDIALISESEGGSGTTPAYFFVNMTPDLLPVAAEPFFSNLDEIKPIQQRERIVIDLGYNEGRRETLIYNRDGRQIIRKARTGQDGDEDKCNYLASSTFPMEFPLFPVPV